MKRAILYKKYGKRIICTACARYCKLLDGQVGFCGIRLAKNNKLYLLNYGIFSSINLDPIEKKPFFHFYPGSSTLSLGIFGCNWACKYCCNYDISQRRIVLGKKLEPEDLVELVKKYRKDFRVSSICFTYNEPTIYAEYIEDVAKIAKKRKIRIIFITNGYLSDEAIDYYSNFADAIAIDFKGNGNDDFGRKFISIPSYQPVFHALEELSRKKIHIEITDLVVPKVGDDLEDCRKLCRTIYDLLGEKAIIHFLRFFPTFRMTEFPETSIETLEMHAKIAEEEGIKFIYIGNVWGHRLENTYCPSCKKIVIRRFGFFVKEVNMKKNRCLECQYKIPIIGTSSTTRIISPLRLI